MNSITQNWELSERTMGYKDSWNSKNLAFQQNHLGSV